MEKKFKILVVEDEEVIRSIFQETFTAWEFEVESAENGREALKKTEQNNFDIIITDLNMPFMNGLELLNKLRDKKYGAEVIVITGFATIDNAIDAMKAGAFDFITKPVNFDHVQFIVNKCTQQIKARQENAELKTLNEKLSELNRLKDKFLSITNHELRTPVTVIKGYIDVLDMYSSENGDEFKEIVDVLKVSTNELVDRLENIHLLSQAGKSGLNMKFKKGNLVPVLVETMKEVHILYKKRKMKLKIKNIPKQINVYADFYRMKQIFREMLQNALKFTQDEGRVVVSCSMLKDKVIIGFEDSGIGIPLDQQDLIFDAFYEIQETVHHKSSSDEFMGGGLGIGLSFVKEIIQAHEGKIEVQSEPEKGSKFLVTIPLVDHQHIKNKIKLENEKVD
ncbi:MAG: response regulator [Calditrichia bacterium]|nr:response regulator [Calditrichia bacterium]